MSNLSAIYRQAAQAAHEAGISAANEKNLVAWIRSNCAYRVDTEYFLVLGIGCELADLEAQKLGYKNEVSRAFHVASNAAAVCNA